MRRGLVGIGFALVTGVVLWAAPVLAYTSPGSPTGHVNDFAHVLSDETVQSLEIDLRAFAASTSNEISVVTVPNMGGDYVENYAVKLFEEWGIGKKDKDNGVLILVAMEEHKLRIEVGYGLEGVLTDGVAQTIIDNDMTPRMKAGDVDAAVETAAHDVMLVTQGEYYGGEASGTSSGSFNFDIYTALIIPIIILQWVIAILARSKSWWAGGVLGFVIGLGVLLFFGLALWVGAILIAVLAALGLGLDYAVSNAYSSAKSAGITPPWWAGGSTGSSSSSSGGSFGGFGGGSSGGGGASGGW